jgi:hypothetical protein
MSKGNTASKNNAALRKQAQQYFHDNKLVKPVRVIGLTSTYFAAEYEGGDLVLGLDGRILPWDFVVGISERR